MDALQETLANRNALLEKFLAMQQQQQQVRLIIIAILLFVGDWFVGAAGFVCRFVAGKPGIDSCGWADRKWPGLDMCIRSG